MSMVLQINPNDDSPLSSARWVPASEAKKNGLETVASSASGDGKTFFSEEGLTFDDVLDMVNPLHHLPIIGPIYRELTGDTLSPGARLIGGTLFGGPVGLVASAMELGVQEEFGRDPGGMLIAAIKGEDIAPNYAPDAVLVGEAVPTGDATQIAAPAAPAAAIESVPLGAPIPLTAAAPAAAPAPMIAQPVTITPASGSVGFNGRAPSAAQPTATATSSGFGPSAQLPPNSTGLLTSSGLPSAGSVTPALTMVQTQNPMQQDPMAKMTGNAGIAAYQNSREAPAAAGQQAVQPAVQTAADGQRWFDLPANRAPVRLATTVPPVIQNPNVGTANTAPAQLGGEPLGAQVLNPIAPSATPGTVNDSMRSALDKYDALVRSRKGAAVNQAS
ncbi:hypothetical protein ACFSM5_03010 [Lacibacterium aquatile]|uniref:Uncharacterized protein n=1 Tax=Lacibacterium aquatile TaxID=1168082 RepID=A0ABW5DPM3_9PROT